MMRTFAIMILFSLSSQPALAENFDLQCSPIANPDRLKVPNGSTHVQVDLERRQWCRDICEEIRPIAATDGLKIVFENGVNRFKDMNRLVYDQGDAVLFSDTGIGADWERNWRYSCEKQDFGRFEKYLARDSYPALNIMKLIGPNDFLKDKSGKKIGGIVSFRIAVDAAGKIGDCQIVESSGYKNLDQHTCDILQQRLRMHFALDRRGSPIASIYSSRVNWFVVSQ